MRPSGTKVAALSESLLLQAFRTGFSAVDFLHLMVRCHSPQRTWCFLHESAWKSSVRSCVLHVEVALVKGNLRLALARFNAGHGDAEGALQCLRKVKERVSNATVSLEALQLACSADLSKTPARSFIADCCTRLLRSPLEEALQRGA